MALTHLFEPEKAGLPDIPLWKRFAGEVAYYVSPDLGKAMREHLLAQQQAIFDSRPKLKDDNTP